MFRNAVIVSIPVFFSHLNRHSAVLSPAPATLRCHPAPSVMGKGSGRASHQYSTAVSVQTHTNTGDTAFPNANRHIISVQSCSCTFTDWLG